MIRVKSQKIGELAHSKNLRICSKKFAHPGEKNEKHEAMQLQKMVKGPPASEELLKSNSSQDLSKSHESAFIHEYEKNKQWSLLPSNLIL